MEKSVKSQMKIKSISYCLILNLLCLSGVALGKDFSVKDNGAKGDGKTDDSKAFLATWDALCASSGPATFMIPDGKYFLGPLYFKGPCKAVPSVTFNMKATLLADPDPTKFKEGTWVFFHSIAGLTLKGPGTFDGQGHSCWTQDKCKTETTCTLLPYNVQFIDCNDLVMDSITSTNPKSFNFAVIQCKNVKITNMVVDSPGDSPNTDGIHIARCSDVILENPKIATGDDCISLGDGLTNVLIKGATCGPGHGISIGSLGKYKDETDVTGIVIQDATLTNTQNGVRIKSWQNTPKAIKVSNITFENISMKNVQNPIIIDQCYCPHGTCPNEAPSKVEITYVTYSKISGTTGTEDAIMLACSKNSPCTNIKLKDIELKTNGSCSAIKSVCVNCKPTYSGTQEPPPCAK